MRTESPSLKIIKASAGSGKTYSLTQEFLILVLAKPEKYKRILAVTFTNKAAEEMKRKIIYELYLLASNNNSPQIKELMNILKMPENIIRDRAKEVLQLILHDYGKFNINTIDSFFQQVIRAFTRELGISPSYSVELDQDSILLEAIERLIMDAGEKTSTATILQTIASDNIESGKNWNVKNNLHELGKELFNESFSIDDNDINVDSLTEYQKTLKAIVRKFESEIKSIAQQGVDLMSNNGLTVADFPYATSGYANHFNKVLKGVFQYTTRVSEVLKNPEKCVSKKSPDNVKWLFDNGMHQLLKSLVDYYDQHKTQYLTAITIEGNIAQLSLLADIQKNIKAINFEKNSFLISDSSKFLNALISENDSPFIYEKTGSFIQHYMIDEFQDTSTMQWENFRPLLENSMAEKNQNLIVGDVKQSIYRWRNGDWEILAQKIEADFNHLGVQKEVLKYNWRSKQEIIEFNNKVFSKASSIIIDVLSKVDDGVDKEKENTEKIPERYIHLIKNAFDEANQNIPENTKTGGYAKIKFIKENKDRYNEIISEELPLIIEDLQINKKVLPQDIAILVRTKVQGRMVSNWLQEYMHNNPLSQAVFNLISDEALQISDSLIIQIITATLTATLNPDNQIVKTQLINDLNNLQINNQSYDNQLIIEILDQLKTEANRPIYEFVELIIATFSLNNVTGQFSYLISFLDIVADFAQRNNSSLGSFMEWWNKKGITKTLSISDNQNAIRLLTIHKSKGLEYEAVIIPFCDWSLDHNTNITKILWVQPKSEPFNAIEKLPIKYAKSLETTEFSDEYFTEKVKVHIDSLNLLYVALTRAKSYMAIFGNIGKTSIATVLKNCLTTEDIHNEFEFGSFQNTQSEKELPSEKEYFTSVNFGKMHGTPIALNENKIIRENGDFSIISPKDYGIIMHDIFKEISTKDDINSALQKFLFAGIINENQMVDLSKSIHKLIENETVKDWFNGSYQIQKEMEILIPRQKNIRPDRVMIKDNHIIVVDYKFGDKNEPKYVQQIQKYKDTLLQMGYASAKGYLWYIQTNEVEEIE